MAADGLYGIIPRADGHGPLRLCRGDVVVDVGAHVGLLCVDLAARFPGAPPPPTHTHTPCVRRRRRQRLRWSR